MSNVLRRIEIPIAITIIATLLQVIPYYVDYKPLDSSAALVRDWMLLLVAWATFIGMISILQVHVKKVRVRPQGWYFSILVIVFMFAMAITGLPLKEIGLGTANPVYQYIFTNAMTPLGGTMYSIIAFFITSAAFRAFRLKGIESSLVLISGIIMVMSNAPLFTVIFPPFKDWGTWIFAVPNMATMRAVVIGTALGAIALAVRTLMGIERGYLRGGGEE